MRRGWIGRGTAFLCALGLVFALCGCQEDPPPASPEEDSPMPVVPTEPEEAPAVLPERFALPYDPDQALDPIECPDGMQQVVGSLICEGLFRLGPDLEPEGVLCESWSYDRAERTWTFVLRQGVTFSDGVSLTAVHVKSALERARESARYRDRLRQIASIRAAGDTVFVHLSAHDTGFPSLLDVPIVRMEGRTPIGTGPYRFSIYGAYLVPNETWWKDAARPVDRIWLEEARDAPLYRFASGDVHLIVTDLTGGPPSGIAGEIRYQDTATTSIQYIACNMDRWPTNRAAFRRALDLGIDREGITGSLLSGHALPARFPVSPASPLYPSELDGPYSSPDFTAAVIESGVELDRSLSLLVNGDNEFKVSAAREAARNWTASGIPVEVRALPWEEYREAVSARSFDLCWCEARLTADWNLAPLLLSWGALDVGGWSDERTARLVEAFAAAEDRPAAMMELCTYLQEQAPILTVCFSNSSVLSRAEVIEGLSPTTAEPFYDLSSCRIHLKESGD